MMLEEYAVDRIKLVFDKSLETVHRSDLDFLSVFIDLSFPENLGLLIKNSLEQNTTCWLVAVGEEGYNGGFIAISRSSKEDRPRLCEGNFSEFFKGGKIKFCFYSNEDPSPALISGYEINQIFRDVRTLDKID